VVVRRPAHWTRTGGPPAATAQDDAGGMRGVRPGLPGSPPWGSLAASGGTLTGVGFTASESGEQPTLWNVPAS